VTVTSFPAPAKLNLMLRVTGRRADGYHLLQTVFRFLDHGDEVRIAVRGDGLVRRTREVAGVAEDDDLTVRAARALKAAARSPLGADIEVVKRLPIGAGLGGGSSDAATVLLALNRLWSTGFTRAALQAIGLTLGADVPVFVFGASAFAQGVGEELEPIALPPAWYVVLTPPVEVPTQRIFAHPDLKRDSKPIKIQGFSAGDGARLLAGYAANDLEALVCRLYPEVARHLEWLKQHGPALMTGSGGSVFAALETERAARDVLLQVPAGMQGFVARGLDTHPLRELAAEA
jgi:4-diphosphocytidyl-2-C-methyl-D-erythritol kinase